MFLLSECLCYGQTKIKTMLFCVQRYKLSQTIKCSGAVREEKQFNTFSVIPTY